MQTKEQYIVTVWNQSGKDLVRASDLEALQRALAQRFGADAVLSPATIARLLADHGARLSHPEILRADAEWRSEQLVFTVADLDFGTLEAAIGLVEKIERLRQEAGRDDATLRRLRRSVMTLKADLDSLADSNKTGRKTRKLAREVAQWLTVWLQNPEIFGQWLTLRRGTADFREDFQT